MNPRDPVTLMRHGIDPYAENYRYAKIAVVVIIVHIGFLCIPMLCSWVNDWIKSKQPPPVVVMKVGLIDLPEGDSLDVPKDQPPMPEPVKPEVKQPDPVPEPPKPEPPKPDPVPEPKPKPKPKPKKTQDEIIKEIQKKRTHKVIENKKAQEERQRQEIQAAQRAARDAKARSEYNKQLAAIQNARYGVKDAGLKGIQATAEDRAYINDRLKPYVDQRYTQPSDSLLHGQKPEVDLELTIAKDGSLVSCKVVKGGGFGPMDDSIEALKEKIRTLPVPPRAMTVTITIRVR